MSRISLRNACLEILKSERATISFVHCVAQLDSPGFIASFDYIIQNPDSVFSAMMIGYERMQCLVANVISKFDEIKMPIKYPNVDTKSLEFIRSRTTSYGYVLPKYQPDTETFYNESSMDVLTEIYGKCTMQPVTAKSFSYYWYIQHQFDKSSGWSASNIVPFEFYVSTISNNEMIDLFGKRGKCEYTHTNGIYSGKMCGIYTKPGRRYCDFCVGIRNVKQCFVEFNTEEQEMKCKLMLCKLSLDLDINCF